MGQPRWYRLLTSKARKSLYTEPNCHRRRWIESFTGFEETLLEEKSKREREREQIWADYLRQREEDRRRWQSIINRFARVYRYADKIIPRWWSLFTNKKKFASFVDKIPREKKKGGKTGGKNRQSKRNRRQNTLSSYYSPKDSSNKSNSITWLNE